MHYVRVDAILVLGVPDNITVRLLTAVKASGEFMGLVIFTTYFIHSVFFCVLLFWMTAVIMGGTYLQEKNV